MQQDPFAPVPHGVEPGAQQRGTAPGPSPDTQVRPVQHSLDPTVQGWPVSRQASPTQLPPAVLHVWPVAVQSTQAAPFLPQAVSLWLTQVVPLQQPEQVPQVGSACGASVESLDVIGAAVVGAVEANVLAVCGASVVVSTAGGACVVPVVSGGGAVVGAAPVPVPVRSHTTAVTHSCSPLPGGVQQHPEQHAWPPAPHGLPSGAQSAATCDATPAAAPPNTVPVSPLKNWRRETPLANDFANRSNLFPSIPVHLPSGAPMPGPPGRHRGVTIGCCVEVDSPRFMHPYSPPRRKNGACKA